MTITDRSLEDFGEFDLDDAVLEDDWLFEDQDLFDLVDDFEDYNQILNGRKVDFDYDYDPEDYPYGFGND